MTLLIIFFAFIITTLVWYCSSTARKLKVGSLCLLFCGANLMFLVDAIFIYMEDKANYFSLLSANIVNDLLLGLAIVALGLFIWLVVVLITDPLGTIKKLFIQK